MERIPNTGLTKFCLFVIFSREDFKYFLPHFETGRESFISSLNTKKDQKNFPILLSWKNKINKKKK